MRLIKDNVERIASAPAQIARYKADGYRPLDGETDTVNTELSTNIDDMDIKELKALAKEKGLEGYSGLNKTELLAVLKGVV